VQKRLNEIKTVVIESQSRDCKSLLTGGRTCTRDDFLSPLHASNPAIEWFCEVLTAAAVVKPCDYLHTDKHPFKKLLPKFRQLSREFFFQIAKFL
jgi:hypothetical protein